MLQKLIIFSIFGFYIFTTNLVFIYQFYIILLQMASSADLSVKQNRSFMQFDAMEMKIYTSEEVRKISVMEITKADTFDEVFIFKIF